MARMGFFVADMNMPAKSPKLVYVLQVRGLKIKGSIAIECWVSIRKEFLRHVPRMTKVMLLNVMYCLFVVASAFKVLGEWYCCLV